MHFYVPPSRIKLLDNFNEGCKLKNVVNNDIFLLVDKEGKIIVPEKSYKAKKPCLAAIKAYYSYIRSFETKKIKQRYELDKDEMNALTLKIKDKDALQKYVEIMCNSNSSDDEPVVVRLIKSNGKKIYNYLVNYHYNLNPNNHEIKHCITKLAKAIPLDDKEYEKNSLYVIH